MHAASAAAARPTPLGLDLHFLLSAWAGNARDEHTIVAWAIRQLHMFPILDASSLSPEAGWGTNEVIQIIPAELSTEDVMRIWDALDPPYRLSVSYIARLVRLDPDAAAACAAGGDDALRLRRRGAGMTFALRERSRAPGARRAALRGRDHADAHRRAARRLGAGRAPACAIAAVFT